MRRRTLVLVVGALVVVGVITGVVLARPGHETAPLTRSAYLARADAICAEYGKKLDHVPPASDPSALGDVLASVNAALPILETQAAEIRALQPPAALRLLVARFFSLTDRSITGLELVRDSAKKLDPQSVAVGLIEFNKATTSAKRVARQIGYRC